MKSNANITPLEINTRRSFLKKSILFAASAPLWANESPSNETLLHVIRVVSGNGIYSTLREFYHP